MNDGTGSVWEAGGGRAFEPAPRRPGKAALRRSKSSRHFPRTCLDVSSAVGHLGRMNPPPPLLPASPAPGGKQRYPWGPVLTAFALVALAVAALPLKHRFELRREVQRELGLCRAAGQAVTLKELAALYPPVPDGENAAIPLFETWREDDPALWGAWQEGRPSLPKPVNLGFPQQAGEGRPFPRGQPLDPLQRAACAGWWRSNEVRMARVQKALQRPGFRFPVHFEDGHQMLLLHLRAMKAEAQRFRLRALSAADAGDPGAALDAIESLGATVRLLEAEPVLIGQLVVVANRTITLRAVEDFLNRHAPAAADLDRLERAVSWSPAGDRLAVGFQGERAMALDLMSLSAGRAVEVMQTLGKTSPPEANAGSAWAGLGLVMMRLHGIVDQDRLNLLRTWRRAVAASDASTASRVAYLAAFDDADKAIRKEPRLIFSRLFLPALRKVWDKFARAETEAGMARVAFAVERFRFRHGQPPASVEELRPEFLAVIPADPFGDGPLRYRRLDHGYLIYSVGLDGEDHGGRPVMPEEPTAEEVTDAKKWGFTLRKGSPELRYIMFTVERPDLSRPGAPPFQRGGSPAPAGGEE